MILMYMLKYGGQFCFYQCSFVVFLGLIVISKVVERIDDEHLRTIVCVWLMYQPPLSLFRQSLSRLRLIIVRINFEVGERDRKDQ